MATQTSHRPWRGRPQRPAVHTPPHDTPPAESAARPRCLEPRRVRTRQGPRGRQPGLEQAPVPVPAQAQAPRKGRCQETQARPGPQRGRRHLVPPEQGQQGGALHRQAPTAGETGCRAQPWSLARILQVLRKARRRRHHRRPRPLRRPCFLGRCLRRVHRRGLSSPWGQCHRCHRTGCSSEELRLRKSVVTTTTTPLEISCKCSPPHTTHPQTHAFPCGYCGLYPPPPHPPCSPASGERMQTVRHRLYGAVASGVAGPSV